MWGIREISAVTLGMFFNYMLVLVRFSLVWLASQFDHAEK